MSGYDVFISFKNRTENGTGLTRDREIAEALHDKLLAEGMNVFFSEKNLSTADFIKEINAALEGMSTKQFPSLLKRYQSFNASE